MSRSAGRMDTCAVTITVAVADHRATEVLAMEVSTDTASRSRSTSLGRVTGYQCWLRSTPLRSRSTAVRRVVGWCERACRSWCRFDDGAVEGLPVDDRSAQPGGSVNVFVQPEKDSLDAIATDAFS